MLYGVKAWYKTIFFFVDIGQSVPFDTEHFVGVFLETIECSQQQVVSVYVQSKSGDFGVTFSL